MDPALGPYVLAEYQHARVGLELMVEHAADCRHHVDSLAVGFGLINRRRRFVTAVPQPADLLEIAFVKDVAGDFFRRGDAPRFGLGTCGLDLPRRFALEISPFDRTDLQLGDMGL